MPKSNKYLFPVTLFLFLAAEIFLLKNKQFQIGILFYIFYLVFLFLVNKNYIISFFVFSLPLLPIIPTEFKLFSVLGPREIIYGISFLVMMQLSKKENRKINEYQKLAIKFVYFLFFINIYIVAKDIIIGIEPNETRGAFYIFKIAFRLFLMFYSFVLLIKSIYTKGMFDYVIVGMKYSIITLVLSMLYSKPLIMIGADIQKKEVFLQHLERNTRFVGFYGAGGDENSAGIFLVSCFAFFLALYDKTGKIKEYIIFFAFTVFGVLLTGSRTAFISLAIVVLIFLITNKSGKSRFAILIACIIFYFTFSKQLDVVVQRFLAPSARAALDPNEKGRVGKWILYTDWILNNPETLVFGNQKKIDYNRAPHNYFIYLIYHAGLVFMLIFLGLMIQLFRLIRFSNTDSTLKNSYYIIPFLLVALTVNTFGSSIYLWLFLPIGAVYLNMNRESKIIK